MTPHNKAEVGSIAKTVIMPGDPMRAKYIAENYLEDYKLVNDVRGALAYTGTYKGRKFTVMSSGMGMPSMGIYAYELYKFYDVSNIIRVGSCGAYTKDLNLYDVLLVNGSYSESSFARVMSGNEDEIQYSTESLNFYIKESAEKLGKHMSLVNIHSSDVFYKENNNFKDLYNKYGCMAVEMESFALFATAKLLNKRAACLLTVSDSLVTHELTTPEERQNSFTDMMEIALNIDL